MKPRTTTHPTIRDQVEEIVKRDGLRHVGRETGVNPSSISRILRRVPNNGDGLPARFHEGQLEAIARYEGKRWVLK